MKKSIFLGLMMPAFLFFLMVTTNYGQKDTRKQNDATSQEVLPSKSICQIMIIISLILHSIRLLLYKLKSVFSLIK